MEDGTVIVMSDVEIAESLVGCLAGEEYSGSYHRPVRFEGYEIVDGVIYLGEGDDFYSYPLSIDQLRNAFNIVRPTP